MHLFGMGYKLFVDNFYTSVRLFRDLLQNGITVCGTMMQQQTEFPQPLKNFKTWNSKAARGGGGGGNEVG